MIMCSSCNASERRIHRCSRCPMTILGSELFIAVLSPVTGMVLLELLAFSTCRKALPNMGRVFQFVDHRDGVILNRNPALAGSVYQELVVSEAELSRALFGRQVFRRAQIGPFKFRLFSQLVQGIDRRQSTWLYPERHIRAVDKTDSRCDLQPARSAHPEHPFDSRLLNRGDDGCCSPDLVVIKVRVLPPRIEGADNGFVSPDQRRKRSRVVNVAGLRCETLAFFKLLRIRHDRCHHVPSVERLLKQCGANETCGT